MRYPSRFGEDTRIKVHEFVKFSIMVMYLISIMMRKINNSCINDVKSFINASVQVMNGGSEGTCFFSVFS